MSALDPDRLAAPAHRPDGPALGGDFEALVRRFATRIDELQQELASVRATIESLVARGATVSAS